MTNDNYDPADPQKAKGVQPSAEDTPAKPAEGLTPEERARRALTLVRSDTGYSEVPPDNEGRESLLRISFLSRVEDAIRAAEQAAREKEREACAQIVEQPVEWGGDRKHQPELDLIDEDRKELAAAIRKRGNRDD